MVKMRNLNRPTGHRLSMLRQKKSAVLLITWYSSEKRYMTRCPLKQLRKALMTSTGTLCAARHASAFVRGDDVLHKLFTEMPTEREREQVDRQDCSRLEYKFIYTENELRQAKPPVPQPPKRAPSDPWTKYRLSGQFAV
ncbi:hypothetical protein Vadar_020170 [Vaccinium darrowii]|uniref:Uncharacterized protein n=1 Tax=Vaccinium darrowii TaxID=229202 RepID=A0ACB7Z540_9ERIC|nr:hypothetical protein Vadar_020170 [Vaccinium darrowii]